MAEELPDDLSRWPKDPYQVLGIARTATSAEARKAYTRLIRRFKPEQFPDHFRLIRDAYETVQAFAAFSFPDIPLPPPPGPADAAESGAAEWATPAPTPEEPPSPLDQRAAVEDSAATLWQQAIAGDAREAYRGLLHLAARPEALLGACLRLYWLLRCDPELDPNYSPCEWLVKAIRQGNVYGPCSELYHREIEHRPYEALTERFDSLLALDVSLPTLAEWLGWRWHAAGRLGNPRVITDDLASMRPRFAAGFADDMWCRLLVAAADQLAWFAGPEAEQAFQECCAEIEKTIHLNSGIDLHRLDILRELAQTWKHLRGENVVPGALMNLVPPSWTHMPAELRDPVRFVLRDLLESPVEARQTLDYLRLKAPLVFAQFVSVVDQVSWQWPTGESAPGDSAELESAVSRFVEEEVTSAVTPPRDAFLTLCLNEFIVPDQIFDLLPPFLAEQLRQDEVLRILCVGYRWMWG